jgi:hypothetical protein
MACDRCGAEPEADMLRYQVSEADDEVRSLLLCPECGYGLNMLLAAYVSRRDVAVTGG